MLQFNPPELKDQIAQAISILTDATARDIREFSDDIVSPADEHFDPATYPHMAITTETELDVSLPEAGCQRPLARTYGEFVALAGELESADIFDVTQVRTKLRMLTRVAPIDSDSNALLDEVDPDPENEEEKQTYDRLRVLRQREHELKRQLGELERSDSNEAVQPRGEWDELLAELREVIIEKSRLRRGTLPPFERSFCQELKFDGTTVVCSLTRGLTVYSLFMLAEGRYDDYNRPGDGDDLFVEVRYTAEVPDEVLNNIFHAFLFELSSDVGVQLEAVPPFDPEVAELPERGDKELTTRLRPLLIGKGMSELLRMYNQATQAPDSEIRIMLLTKVIEYVSQTVVRQNLIQTLRSKLLSPRALEPDARYIIELASLVEEQRSFGKDREAIKLTVRTCCDAGELAKLALQFLKEMMQISVESNQSDRDKALEKFGVSLADTRNSIAHAKSNYAPTGNECPDNERDEFTQCVKLAAQQAIRWYHTQSEVNRVT